MTIHRSSHYFSGPGCGRDGALGSSLEVLDAVGRAGLVLVPEMPTARMLRAGKKAGAGSELDASRIFAAMLAAAE